MFVKEREEHAADGSHAVRYDDRVHLVAKRVDAERARGNLILADRLPVIADATPEQNVAKPECRDGKREHHIVEHRRIAAQVPKIVAGIVGDRQEEAARPAHPSEVIEADARELGEGDGEDCEIDAAHAEAEGEEADDRTACHRDRDRRGQSDPGPETEMDIERRGRVAAEPDIDGVAEGELAGEAHHHVPRLAGIGGIEDDDKNGEEIVVRHPGRRQQHDEQRRQKRNAAARNSRKQPPDHDSLFPRMPCGRNSSTSTSRPKENMLLADGVKNKPAMASVSPISTPPSSAPGMEPRPPVMTMMKASSVKAGPNAGVTSTSSTSMAPAAPTQA